MESDFIELKDSNNIMCLIDMSVNLETILCSGTTLNVWSLMAFLPYNCVSFDIIKMYGKQTIAMNFKSSQEYGNKHPASCTLLSTTSCFLQRLLVNVRKISIHVSIYF